MIFHFTKMHGCGNDYIYADCTKEDIGGEGKLSLRLSDRHFGIGSDGLILIRPSECADFKMSMYNADGSEGKMCGNGIRCVGKYVYDHGLTEKENLTIETRSGIKELTLHIKDHKVETVTVDMGEPILSAAEVPAISPTGKERILDEALQINGREWRISCVSMGNPHCITFVDDPDELDLPIVGPLFEHHSMFPEQVNTAFIQLLSREELRIRTWERGSGETLACGTNNCAAVVASVLLGVTEETVLCHTRGGDLKITYDRGKNRVFMEGPATEVFSGQIEVEDDFFEKH